jgi:hypothetical protein
MQTEEEMAGLIDISTKETAMHDWNAVITVREGGFVAACRLLEPFGPVK